jgi:thiol-disulfide isomerase/thioredoxin
MENKDKNGSMMKMWPLWLIIVAIALMIVMNIGKNKTANEVVERAQTDERLSGKALSLVPVQQFFMPNRFGTKCPDFEITTLDGKNITLSSLAGKEVMFVFWATWCPPCRNEIPYIIQLRNEIGEDKLEIIAFSSERQEVVSDFVTANGINYKVATGSPQSLPDPFNRVTALPTIFFIDSLGRLKIAVEGGISYAQMKGIIQAD